MYEPQASHTVPGQDAPGARSALFFSLLDGIALYSRCALASLAQGRNSLAPLSLKRFLLLLALPVFLAIQLVHALCLLLDELLFARLHRVDIGRALFIAGIPRSGTTFLHRTLADSSNQFTTLTTWEALLAPSIVQRRVFRALGHVDRALGAPGNRVLAWLVQTLSGGLEDIHSVNLHDAEEDYLALLPVGGCFILLLAFPFSRELQQLADFPSLSPCRQQRLLGSYQALLQRHLYAHPGKQLLSKNAAFASWVPALRQRFPEARFMLCIREPVAGLNSQISAVEGAASILGARAQSPQFQKLFLDNFSRGYQLLADDLENTGHTVIVDMADLRANAGPTLLESLLRLKLTPDKDLCKGLMALPRNTRAARVIKAPEGLDTHAVNACLQRDYQRLLQSPQRIQVSP